MNERLIIIIAAGALFLLGMKLLKQWQLRQAQTAATESNGLTTSSDVPQIVYFWSNQCTQCKTVQKPVLDRLLANLGDGNMRFLSINVNETPEMARTWGVKSVPTIYVLDKDDNVLHVNNGIATERKLLEQLAHINTASTA